MVKQFLNVSPAKFGLLATTAAVTATISAFVIDISPHTVLLKKYKSIIQMYRLGEPIEIHHEVRELFLEVLDDLKINDKIRNKYDVFPVVGFNVYHAGLSDSPFGAIVGVPINFVYKSKHLVDISEICLGKNREPINIYHPAAEDLTASLTLSKKAKKFGIAREIAMLQKDLPVYKSCESSLLAATTIIMADMARTNFNITKRSLIFMVYGASALLGYTIWFQIRDALSTYFEKEVDKELSNLGPEYIEGGKEFYDKILKRNIAIRALLGAEGVKEFNRDGDEIFFIRHKRTPITHRKRFFNEISLEGEKQPA